MISATLFEAAREIRQYQKGFPGYGEPGVAEKIRIVLAVMDWVRAELNTVPEPISEALTARCFDGVERSLSPVADRIVRGMESLHTEAAKLQEPTFRN